MLPLRLWRREKGAGGMRANAPDPRHMTCVPQDLGKGIRNGSGAGGEGHDGRRSYPIYFLNFIRSQAGHGARRIQNTKATAVA